MTRIIEIPIPSVRPLGLALDKPEFVHEVWDTFVTEDPATEAALPQSSEMRMLMAILRSLHDALHSISPCTQEGCVTS